MKKSQEILDKHLENSDVKHILEKYSVAYNACLDAMKEAINYSPCCKSDSEQLVLFSRFMSNNSKKAAYMTSTELLEEFKKQN